MTLTELDELLEETVAGRVERYARAARQLRAGFERLGLEILLPDEWRSNSITTIRLPEGATYPPLHDHLKADGFVIYEGQGQLGATDVEVIMPPSNSGHYMGGHRMGDDPRESVLNAHNQSHDVPNLFVTDGSFMTSASCVNPSLTYMAFTARACDYAAKQLAEGAFG